MSYEEIIFNEGRMWQMHEDGWTQQQIANYFSIGKTTVGDFLRKYSRNLGEFRNS